MYHKSNKRISHGECAAGSRRYLQVIAVERTVVRGGRTREKTKTVYVQSRARFDLWPACQMPVKTAADITIKVKQ